MATAETTLITQKTTENSQQKPNKRKRKSQNKRDAAAVVDRFDSLRWNPSLPSDEPISLFVGTNELEGGFLSLEEIDESEYGLGIPEQGVVSKKQKVKKNGNKAADKGESVSGDVEGSSGGSPEDGIEEEEEEVVEAVEEKVKDKKKKKKKKNKNKSEKTEALGTSVAVGSDGDELEDDSVVETEFYAWNDLRLHPLLMKSIVRLGFKEPTPIQKACIPAASHQGKDVVGAAETGSGKTLAFGLPILQRLLEERLKVERVLEDKGEAAKIYAPRGVLRALIITPTRELAIQVTDHIKKVAKGTNLRAVPIVGGMSSEKQERLLKARPEIVIGTPGRLWELMSGGEKHLLELHSLSFFVLDEADRMIENGHFRELQSIIEMLPGTASSVGQPDNSKDCVTVSSSQRKKRQTLVFSATLSLSADFRKKLKRGSLKPNKTLSDDLNSIESLSERAGMRPNAAIIDLTKTSILAEKIEEAFVECNEENKDAYLYYILSVHGQGRTIVFCTSIAALRHISSLLRILGINVWTLHAQMQQRARLKAVDRFRANENAILVATDVAARGLDIQNVRTVVHYQLPHSADVYVHRSGRTARALTDGCSIALISSSDTSKFASLCKSFSKESFKRFPLDESYMPEVLKRLSLARQIDKMLRKESQEKAKKTWYERNAESLELILEKDDSEDERVNNIKRNKINSVQLKKLQQELKSLLSCPLQPKTFSRRYFAGAGISTLLQHQIEELAGKKRDNHALGENGRKLVVIGQDCVEPLQALRNASNEVNMEIKDTTGKQRNAQTLRRKRKEEKKRLRDQRRKKRKIAQGKDD